MKYTIDQWRDVSSVFYEVTPLGDHDRFAVEMDARRHNRLICTEVRFTGQEFTHDPTRIKGVDHNFLLYERYFSGQGRGVVADAPTHIDQGSIHLIDMSRRYRAITSDVITAGVCIPHDMIGYDPTRDPHYRSVPIGSPQGRMLDLAHNTLREAMTRDKPETAALADTFLTLVRKLMLKTIDTPPGGQQDIDRLPLLRTYIARNLHDTELSAEQICRDVGLSRSALYREFHDDGGVMRFIADRRLDRCFADLMATPASRGAVGQVAGRWGFHHPGNFHRRFRERFGMSPSDCLDHNDVPAAPNQGGAFHPIMEWMRAA